MNTIHSKHFQTLTVVFIISAVLCLLGWVGSFAIRISIDADSGLAASPAMKFAFVGGILVWFGITGVVVVGLRKRRRWAAFITATLAILLTVTFYLYALPEMDTSKDKAYVAGQAMVPTFVFGVATVLLVFSLIVIFSRRTVDPLPYTDQANVLPPLPPGSSYPSALLAPTTPIAKSISPSLPAMGASMWLLIAFCLTLIIGIGLGVYSYEWAPKDPANWGTVSNWQEFNSEEFEFSASFPGEPELIMSNEELDGDMYKTGKFVFQGHSFAVLISATPYPKRRLDAVRNPRLLVEKSGNAWIEDGWKSLGTEDLTIGKGEDITFYGSYARRGRIRDELLKQNGEALLVHAGTIGYVVMVVAEDAEIVSHFMDSFKIHGEPGYKSIDSLTVTEEGAMNYHPDDDKCTIAVKVSGGYGEYNWRMDPYRDDQTADAEGDRFLLHFDDSGVPPTHRYRYYVLRGRVWDSTGNSNIFRIEVNLRQRYRKQQELKDAAIRQMIRQKKIKEAARLKAILEKLPSRLPSGYVGEAYKHTLTDDLLEKIELVGRGRRHSWMEIKETSKSIIFEGTPSKRYNYWIELHFKLGDAVKIKTFQIWIDYPPGVRFRRESVEAKAYAGSPFWLRIETIKNIIPSLRLGDGAPDWLKVAKVNGYPAICGIAEPIDDVAKFYVYADDDSGFVKKLEIVLTSHYLTKPNLDKDGVSILPPIRYGSDYFQPLFEFRKDAVSILKVTAGALPENMELFGSSYYHGFADHCYLHGKGDHKIQTYDFTLEATTRWGELYKKQFRVSVENMSGTPLSLNNRSRENVYVVIDDGCKIGSFTVAWDKLNRQMKTNDIEKFNWQYLGPTQKANLKDPVSIKKSEDKSGVEHKIFDKPVGGIPPKIESDGNIAEMVDWENIERDSLVVIMISPFCRRLIGLNYGEYMEVPFSRYSLWAGPATGWDKVRKTIKDKNLEVVVWWETTGDRQASDLVGAFKLLTGGTAFGIKKWD